MKLSASIALRFLKSGMLQTVVIILGIGVGVSVLIFVGTLIQGLQDSLIEKTVGNTSQITVSADTEGELVPEDPALINTIEGADARITVVSPVIDAPALLDFGDTSKSVLLRGLEISRGDGIYHFSDQLSEGRMPEGEGEFILGSGIADEFGLSVGEEISLVTADKKTHTGILVGIFSLQVAAVDDSWCVASLETIRLIAGVEKGFTSIEMKVNRADVFAADEMGLAVSNALQDSSLKVENWKDSNEQLLSGLSGQSISSLMIQIFVMASVVLGIASVLAITVIQKSKQIGILKAMGIKNRTTSLVFLLEGLFLGILGTAVGIAFGLGLAAMFSKFAQNPDGTPLVPMQADPRYILISAGAAILACLVAALIPARRSSKLDPMEIIRDN